MKTLMPLPFLLAFVAAVAAMPTNVYQICAWNAGTLEIEPWRSRAASALRSVAHALRAWLLSLWSPRLAFASAAMLLAIMLATQSAEGLLLAVPPVAAAPLVERRAQLLREAEALRGADGTFADDQARSTFDARMAEIEQLDTRIRAAERQPAPEPAPATAAAPPDAAAAERERILGIQTAVRGARLPEAFGQDLVTRGVSLVEARSAILDRLVADQQQAPTSSAIATVPGGDATDKWRRGAMNWLLVRAGLVDVVAKHEGVKPESLSPGEFRGMSLLDLGKDYLQRSRIDFRGRDRMDVAGLMFRNVYQTTSDFAVLLENTMHKILRASYALAPDTWSLWCGIGTATDFRNHNWYRVGGLTELEDKNEHGEFRNKTIPDGEKASFAVKSKGNIIAITRETIVNDDLGSMTQLVARLGRAGKLTIENAAYNLLKQNGGLGPTQSDGEALFHANRSNVNGTGSGLTPDGLDADRVIMAQQKDVNKVDFIDLRPDVLLVPVGLGGQARVVNEMEFDAESSNKFRKPNMVRGLFGTIVDTPRLTGTRRYLFADPSQFPVFLVSFLEGQREPVLETKDGWRVDGVEMRARLDVGVDVVDYRGAVTNAGA